MNNEIWKINNEYLVAYVEDKNAMKKIKRSYPQFAVMAEYVKDGKVTAVQYRVPIEKRKTITRMLSVPVS